MWGAEKMKSLVRNKRVFYYCPFIRKEPVLDDNNYETGDYRVVYGSPVKSTGNISEARGQAQEEQFGTQLNYDKVIVIDNPDFTMNEHSVLFVDSAPSYDSQGNPKYDYVVSQVARSLNSSSYAISKVNVL